MTGDPFDKNSIDDLLRQPGAECRLSEEDDTDGLSGVLNKDISIPGKTDKMVLDTIFGNIHFLVAYMDTDFKIIQVNKAYARAGGHPQEFFIGKNHFDLYPNKENERIFREILETGRPCHVFEKSFVYPDRPEMGVTYWDWSALPIKGDDGRIEGIILCLVDVTERKQAQAALQEVQETFRLVTENMEDVFWMCTPGMGEMLYVNPAYERVWGESRQSLYEDPKSFLDSIYPEDRGMVEAAVKDRDQGKWSFEYRIIRPDGSIRWIHDHGFPLRDEKGQLKLIAGIASDITHRKSMEEDIRHYVEELERSNKELEDFAYVSSHDLQEPLRKIQTFGGRLAAKHADALGEDGRDYLERMNKAATRMRRLIDDLLTYSRITTKASPFSQVQIGDIVQEAVSNLETRIKETGGSVNMDGIAIRIESDPTQMLQLFQNLIGNSLKFHRQDVPPVIRIYAQIDPPSRKHRRGRPPTPKTCRIFVEDNGIGFEEKYVDRIFEPFQRLHGRFEYEGTGMGLAICRKIVERHGGVITAKSKPGEGSIFSVTLPLKQDKRVPRAVAPASES